jgi:hypothetical protein
MNKDITKERDTVPAGTILSTAVDYCFLDVLMCVPNSAGAGAGGLVQIDISDPTTGKGFTSIARTLALDPWSLASSGPPHYGAYDTFLVPVPAGYRAELVEVHGAVQVLRFVYRKC